MLKIDIHTHILPKDIPDWKQKFGYGGFITLDHYQPCCARMLRDDGKQFREVGKQTGVGFSPKSGMNASVGDVLNHGKYSIYVSNISEESILI